MAMVRSTTSDDRNDLSQGLGTCELAKVLFASALQESDHPSPMQVHAAIKETLAACGGDCSACASCVAQEAGDHPEVYVSRMRWALRTVEHALPRSAVAAA